MLASIPQPTHFKTLDFSGTFSSFFFFYPLLSLPHCIILIFSYKVNSIGGEGAESIAKALANNAALTRLDLGGTPFNLNFF